MYKQIISLAVIFGLVFTLAPAAPAVDIHISDPLVPTGLVKDDVFQLAFICSQSLTQGADRPFTLTAQTETDITEYNRFLQELVDTSSPGDKVRGYGLTWKCIGSTAAVNARDNAVLGAATPLYDVNGGKIADGFTDLWNGDIDKPINVTETGGSNDQEVLTGSNTDGTGASGLQLGTGSNIQRGDASWSNSQWIVNDDNGDENSKIYAMSDTLTVIPEPTSATLLVLGLLGLIGFARRRKR